MAVRIRFKGDYNLKELIKETEQLDGKRIRVAPQGERNEFLAAIHEYGVQIRVTDKMRGYLASKGLYLKKSTSFINIPERSFMRAGWDQNEMTIVDTIVDMAKALATGNTTADDLLNQVGGETAELIKDFAKDLDSPKNNPFTIKNKGFDDPLIESGKMVGSIDYEIE